MSSRLTGIDAVRVITMLTVVVCHVYPGWYVQFSVAPWNVSLFFMLTGLLWSGRRSLAEEVRLRASTLLVPYALWLAILGTTGVIAAQLHGTLTESYVIGQLWGGAFLSDPIAPFWFAPALFFAAVFYWGVSRWPLAVQWLVAVAVFAAAAYLPGEPLKYLPLSMGQGLACVVFVVAGRTLQHIARATTARWLPGLAMLAIGAALQVGFRDNFLDIRIFHFGTPGVSLVVAVLLSAGLLLVSEPLFRRVSGRVATAITWLAMATLVVMFVQSPIALAFGWSLSPADPHLQLPQIIAGVTLTALVSWSIGLGLLALPRIRVLTGSHGAPPSMAPPRRRIPVGLDHLR